MDDKEFEEVLAKWHGDRFKRSENERELGPDFVYNPLKRRSGPSVPAPGPQRPEDFPLWLQVLKLFLNCPVQLPFWLPVWYLLQGFASAGPVRVWGVTWDPSVPFAAFWLRGILVWVFGCWPLFQLLCNMFAGYENPHKLKAQVIGPLALRGWHCFLLCIPFISICICGFEEFARVMHSLNGKWPLVYAAVRPWLAN